MLIENVFSRYDQMPSLVTVLQKNTPRDSPCKKKVAAYCRVSTLQSSQEGSLQSQHLHFEQKISSDPTWELAEIYLDSGVSGTCAENRPELQRLLSDCHSGKIDLILTKSISRFARNASDCLKIVRSLVTLGVDIWFEKENIRTDTMSSEFLLSILSSLAEEESRSISDNIKWGIQARFRSGTYIQSVVPYGYRKVKDGLIVHQEEAEIIRFIYASVLSGKGVASISHDLNNKGIPSPSGRKWGRSTLLAMIRNPVYKGDMVYQKSFVDEHYHQQQNHGEVCQFVFSSHHEAIVSYETFQLASLNIHQRGKEYGVLTAPDNPESIRRKRHSVFIGKIFCAACGSAMRRSSSGRYPIFSCSGKNSVESCSSHTEMEASIKNAFLTCMNKLAWSQKLPPNYRIIDVFFNLLREEARKKNALKLEAIDKQLEKNRKLLSGLISSPAFRSFPNRIDEVSVLEKEFVHLQEKKHWLESRSEQMLLVSNLQTILSKWVITSSAEAFPEDLFCTIVKRVDVHGQNFVTFSFLCGLTLTESLKRDGCYACKNSLWVSDTKRKSRTGSNRSSTAETSV